MKSFKIWLETNQKVYYHGSFEKLPIGTILTPRLDYEKNWEHTDFYRPLEMYRPANQLAHSQSVFMCDNPDDIDLAGGATNWIFTVIPLGVIQKHDLNWSSEISMLISNGYKINSPEIIQAAGNYWQGIPHHDENVWEYLTTRAKIIKVEEGF